MEAPRKRKRSAGGKGARRPKVFRVEVQSAAAEEAVSATATAAVSQTAPEDPPVAPLQPENLVIFRDAHDAPLVAPDLATLVHPLSAEDFCSTVWRRHVLVARGSVERFSELVEDHMFGLDLDSMLENTRSEAPHVWMTRQPEAGGGVDSFEAPDTTVARLCYDSGGSLYFQASAEMTNTFVPPIAHAVGLDFGAVDVADGQIRGEIETFVAHKGHTTQWHFDFMENWTLQLQGKKRWSLLPADPCDPYRSCATHFNDYRTLHQQLKLHRLARADFIGPPSEEALQRCAVVTLEPGDIMYHPAGVWHKVECTEDSISINISLMGQRWCDIVCDGIKQALLAIPGWRAPVSLTSEDRVGEARTQLRKLLARLPQDISHLRAEDFLPRSLFIPRTPRVVAVLSSDVNSEMPVTKTARFRRNPLAMLVEMESHRTFPLAEDDDEIAQWLGTGETEIPDNSRIYFVHVNFGNDSLRSHSEVALAIPEHLVPITNAISVKSGCFALLDVLLAAEAVRFSDVKALCRALVWNGFMQLCLK